MEVLDISLKHIKYIYHIGDIHIRNLQRHDEYRQVFNEFFNSIKYKKDSIILIAGDVAHAKTDMSPELVKEISTLLSNCANILPTILIAGNHDANLNNKSRLDVLSPIIDNLDDDNLFYLRDSGLYKCADVLFNVMSVFDDSDDYIKHKDIPKAILNKVNTTVALFHGPINNSKTDVGYVVSNRSITVDTFAGHDLVLCGDIHKHQVINEKDPLIVFCGSMVQQNFGEDINGHGYVLWDVPNRTFEHFDIKNDYGYTTAYIVDNKLTTDLSNIPEKSRLRIKISNSDTSKVKDIVKDIRKDYKYLSEITYVREVLNSLKTGNRQSKLNIENVSDVNVQNKLISDYLLRTFPIMDEDTLEEIQNINIELNDIIRNSECAKNITWIPKKFTFDNMFSYGESNVIDFTKTKNVLGLFAPNASGKSSLIDALSFCLFDKSSRAFKASHVMHTNKVTMKCEFNFEINGVDYFIKRIGKRNKNGDVKVDVDFWKEHDGEVTSLNGEQRRATNDVIRDYIGSYEDFILTTLSIQNNNSNFIDKGQSERKDLLAQFMGINVFDQLYTKASEEYKELSTLIKNFNKEDYTEKLADIEIKINNFKKEYSNLIKTRNNIEIKIKKINGEIFENTSKIINLEIDNDDIHVLETTRDNIIKLLNDYTIEFNQLNEDRERILKDLNQNKILLDKFDYNYLEKQNNNFINFKDDLTKLNNDIDSYKLKIQNKIEKLKHLDDHEYDPNCSYCMNNIFVKDAIKTRKSLEYDKVIVKQILDKRKQLSDEIENIKVDVDSYNEYNDLNKKINDLSSLLNGIENKIEFLKTKGRSEKQGLDIIKNKIDLYYKSINIIEENNKINKIIVNLKNQLNELNKLYSTLNDEISEKNGEIKILETEQNNININIKKVKDIENKHGALQYYLDVIKRDGVPYELICKSIPVIEQEINDILSQVVDFNIILETDGKNINANIIYDESIWPLDLGSGMEKFVSSLAIRIALTNISNLPRPPFLVIDEGFGVMDSSNLSSIFNVFNYLKTKFDFIIIISHIDSLRDVVDGHIEIKKENGFSKVSYL